VARVVLLFLPQNDNVGLRIDARVLAFAFICSVVTALICGLAPALQTGRTPLVASLNDRSVKDRVFDAWRELKSDAQQRIAEIERKQRTIRERLDRLDEAFLYERSID
jgi:uncharacterized membrane protein